MKQNSSGRLMSKKAAESGLVNSENMSEAVAA